MTTRRWPGRSMSPRRAAGPASLAMIAEATAIGRAPHRAGRLQEVVAGLLAKGASADGAGAAGCAALCDHRCGAGPAGRPGRGRARRDRRPARIRCWPSSPCAAAAGGTRRAMGARALAGIDDGLARRFDHAFRALFASNAADAVVTLAERELAPHGGMRFDGDVQVAHRLPGAHPRLGSAPMRSGPAGKLQRRAQERVALVEHLGARTDCLRAGGRGP